MAANFHCSNCDAEFSVGNSFKGRQVKCPFCGVLIAASPENRPADERPPRHRPAVPEDLAGELAADEAFHAAVVPSS